MTTKFIIKVDYVDCPSQTVHATGYELRHNCIMVYNSTEVKHVIPYSNTVWIEIRERESE